MVSCSLLGTIHNVMRTTLSRRHISHRLLTAKSFTHLSDDQTMPIMVDITDKTTTQRIAKAESTLRFPKEVLAELTSSINRSNSILQVDDNTESRTRQAKEIFSKKGPVFTTATIAGVIGAKKTSELIPFCHPLPLDDCQIEIEVVDDERVKVSCTTRVTHKTGVEMEAMTGASVAALTIYDMCKALTHEIVIESTRLVRKSGGKRDF